MSDEPYVLTWTGPAEVLSPILRRLCPCGCDERTLPKGHNFVGYLIERDARGMGRTEMVTAQRWAVLSLTYPVDAESEA